MLLFNIIFRCSVTWWIPSCAKRHASCSGRNCALGVWTPKRSSGTQSGLA